MICTTLQNGEEESQSINFVVSRHKFTRDLSGWFHLALDCKEKISQLFFDG